MKTEQNWISPDAYNEAFAAWLDKNEKKNKRGHLFTLLFGNLLEKHYQPIPLKMRLKK